MVEKETYFTICVENLNMGIIAETREKRIQKIMGDSVLNTNIHYSERSVGLSLVLINLIVYNM